MVEQFEPRTSSANGQRSCVLYSKSFCSFTALQSNPLHLTLIGGPGGGTSCVLRTQKAWSLTTLPPRLRATVTRSR